MFSFIFQSMGIWRQLSFASKRLFAQTLFSLRFAYGHILHQSHATRDYRHMLISVYLTWNALPTRYRALFYCCVVSSIDSLLNRYQFKLVPSLKAKQYVESVLELRQRWTVEAKQATLLHASTNNQFDVVLMLLQDPLVNPACHNEHYYPKSLRNSGTLA
ncbi:hypothetical protein BDR26DRAFT_703324 [Obelidium mucronatum]|nr:hypothetical protein BDR26DRAFT_703324 [Obelidium mucronatum]